jgi:hypothetical protein
VLDHILVTVFCSSGLTPEQRARNISAQPACNVVCFESRQRISLSYISNMYHWMMGNAATLL